MNEDFKSIVFSLGIVALAMLSSFINIGDPCDYKSNFSSNQLSLQEEFQIDDHEQSLIAIIIKGNRLIEPTEVQSETNSDLLFLVSPIQKFYTYYSFSQYKLYINNCLINNRKSDIIFPFHYFW